MRGCLGSLGDLVGYGLVTLLYVLLVAGEFAAVAYFGYASVYAPMAAAPGSRDGAGLLIVGLFILFGIFVAWSILAAMTAQILQAVFPWWTPPETSE